MIDLEASIEEQRHGQDCAEGCCKAPNDMLRYRTIIERARPEGVIEIGTYSGKSALWFAQTAGCPVITVDVQHHTVDWATEQAARQAGVTFIIAHSTSLAARESVEGWAEGKQRILLTLDGDHSAGTVLQELNTYTQLVTAGGYCVVEDGIIRWVPEQLPYYGNSGPLDAIEAWLPAHQDWEVDLDLEDAYPTTQFPSGWLRRL